MKRISSPIESLIKDKPAGSTLLEVDYLVVGSGYGGAVAAMRLASDGTEGPVRRVAVLERGREYGLGDFPYDIEDIPSHVRILRSGDDSGVSGYADALFNIHVGSVDSEVERGQPAATDVLVGSGLGGTSLINANVAEEPQEHVFKKPAWPEFFRNTPAPLAAEFDAVREHLGVTRHTGGRGGEFPKFTALRRLGQSLGAEARPASLAITTGLEANKVGVQQNPCTDCGNCVTGCNVGAKNTLDRNLLPLAKSRGASFYTGATVHTVEPLKNSGFRWLVNVHATVQPSKGIKPNTYQILAHHVILAAGTLGSTEILLRSESKEAPLFSSKLGQRFSTNGDGIAMSYAQESPVKAIAEGEQRQPQQRIGPTITGILQTQRLTIEEAGIPASLSRVFSELVTTGAMLQRLSNRKLPGSLEDGGQDPLAASMAVADHCQALLVMGDDGAAGELGLSALTDRITVSFPSSKENDALLRVDSMLKTQDRAAGLDGGQYVPNPLWQLLPPQASSILGELPDGRVLTVHPLGGCAMGDDVASGVVNDAGQVFDRAGGVHEGLYVFDGAIIPAALEVNPFLTISALAWRNANLILQEQRSTESSRNLVSPQYNAVGEVPVRQRLRPGTTDFVIREQLTGELNSVPSGFSKLERLKPEQQHRLKQAAGLVVEVRAVCPDGLGWLDNPAKAPLQAEMDLYVNPFDAAEVETFRPVGVSAQQLKESYPEGAFLSLRGTFTLFAEDNHNVFSDIWGGAKAVLTYVKRRGFGDLVGLVKDDSGSRSWRDLWNQIRTFCNIGALQNRRRRLRYEFESADKAILISGEKVLGYSCELPRLWDGLFNLDLKIQAGDTHAASARLKVNTEALLEPGLVAVDQSPNLPQSLLFAGGLTAYALRSLVMTNFWEFGGLEYSGQEEPSVVGSAPEENLLPPLETDEGDIPVYTRTLSVPIRPGCKPEQHINLLLSNYRRKGAQPILLLHGLAQGSEIFWTQGITNMARYFYERNFDVWLLDYRLSNLVLPHLEDQEWSIDEIARFDIPLAIEAVYSATGEQKVAIFAHCVGACSLAMAVLRDHSLSAKIHAAVTNAIHPWVMPSPGNRFRAKLGNVSRDWITDDLLHPVPRKSDSAVHRLIDRVAFSLARMREVHDDHTSYGGSALVNGICDRMTFLYGRMWNHENLHHTTHDAFEKMLGPSPVRVYQHLYYFTQLRRITSEEGENIYLQRSNIERNWNIDILFVHGGDSLVFNPHSARRSAKRLSELLQQRSAHDKPVIGYQIFDGYGHMDVVFGKDAYRTCFPDYLEFLRKPSAINDPINADDWPEACREKPLIGPILRAAWVENDRIHLRYNAELRGDTIDPPVGLVASGDNVQGVAHGGIVLPFPHVESRPQYQFVDVEIKDAQRNIALQICSEFPDFDVRSGAAVHYHDEAWLKRLREGQSDDRKRLCFIVGSCRFPGSVIDNGLSDGVYSAILEHITGPTGAQLLFLVGDQIYADATDQLFEVNSLNSRFTDRYRRAFGAVDSPNFNALVRQIPTHFALDDHEFADNFSGVHGEASDSESQRWQYAREMAACYMSSVRNQLPVGTTGAALANGPFYYPLAHPQECDFPVFVMDTRSQRQLRCHNRAGGYTLIDDPQFKALTRWLQQAADNAADSPKFIVSGSIVVPLPAAYCSESSTWRRLDGWAGYPETLEAVLAYIVEHGIRNVFFVGGDAHLSAVAKLQIQSPGYAAVDVWQIVSSGLYAPMPFANSHVEDYLWDVSHRVPVHVEKSLTITCTNTLLSDVYSQFVEVDASASAVRVTCRDHNNIKVAEQNIQL
ncbi:Cholesterol oxidase [Halioglobus japonicus]|nr:Cholesterol oxidase [Halioglobus japonicus]